MTQSNTPDTNGWSRAEMHVMEELSRLSLKLDAVDEKLTNLRIDVAKTGAIWGAVSGIVVAVIGYLAR